MKYHFQIVSSFDPTDILVDRSNEPYAKAYSLEECYIQGEAALKALGVSSYQYYVKSIPSFPDVVGEPDFGDCYPGI